MESDVSETESDVATETEEIECIESERDTAMLLEAMHYLAELNVSGVRETAMEGVD